MPKFIRFAGKAVAFFALIATFLVLHPVNAFASQYGYAAGFDADDIDTRRSAYWMDYYMDKSGYGTALYNNISASSTYNQIPGDDVAGIFSHANAGFITVLNNGDTEYIIAGKGGEQNQSDAYYISTYDSNDISDLTFWVFGGCKTAKTSSTYGDILGMCYDKGVDSTMAFYDNLVAPSTNTDDYMNYYFKSFFMFAYSGCNVQTCANWAMDNYYTEYGSYDGFDSWQLIGSNVYLN